MCEVNILNTFLAYYLVQFSYFCSFSKIISQNICLIKQKISEQNTNSCGTLPEIFFHNM